VVAPMKLHEVKQWRHAAVQPKQEDKVGGSCGTRLHAEKTYSAENALL
jgi:hypothetical protein